MFKNFIYASCHKKIARIKPELNINLNKEMSTPSLREVAAVAGIVAKINSYEDELRTKPDIFFKEKTLEFRAMISDRLINAPQEEYRVWFDEAAEEILPFYFAMVREAGRRVLNMRHFDVQMVGGIMLNRNRIAEMVTGEGKTLVGTLPIALNALSGKGVHVVTVNDYLARRDREWMGPLYEFLGFSVGVIQTNLDKPERKQAYACDITYGTNNEFGFDYLRDNMVGTIEDMVQRGHFFAVVDEVDSILIDEARTPLIISGPAELSTSKYYRADKAARGLKVKRVIQSYDSKDGQMVIKNIDGTETRIDPQELEKEYDAVVEEKSHNAFLTPSGERKCEKFLNVSRVADEQPDQVSSPWIYYLIQALRAHYLFCIDKDYIIKDGGIMIVDEFTGRLMPGRRWSDGLHQAVEAKEELKIQEESQTLATVTLQNYFRMYSKLAGMTGTASTEANEFKHIYSLDVVSIPTNRPLIRESYPDRIYKTKKAKFNAVIEEIEEMYKNKRPVMAGTTSIDDSEQLSFLLNKKGIPHNVLNAKYHQKEASIIAQAGKLGQVTIATNMAGRGTDIVLGGSLDHFIKDALQKNDITFDDPRYKEEYAKLQQQYKSKFDAEHDQVVNLGGLHIIGTQRHEARRIDNQLRGRSGRQGDPGSSRFYVSLEDDLMRLFGSERIYFMMDKLGFPENESIEHPIINGSLAIAQKRVETHNFEIRKHLLDYDNIMNKQREVIYCQRRQVIEQESLKDEVLTMMEEVVDREVPLFFGDEPNITGLVQWLKAKMAIELTVQELTDKDSLGAAAYIKEKARAVYEDKEKQSGSAQMRGLERMVSLWIVDSRWKEHLLVIDSLKEGIHLRGYAQSDPLVEYKKESHVVFAEMIDSIKDGIVDMVFKSKMAAIEKPKTVFEEAPKNYIHSEYSSLQEKEKNFDSAPSASEMHSGQKIGRNDMCPCGSNKKYKKCCMK